MTSLAIPQTGEPRRTNIRAVRSATSLRTPHTSQEQQQQHGHQQQHTTLSRSPPDLSFSQSSLLSHNEADFMSNTRLHPAGAGNPRHQNSSGQLRDASNTGSSSTGKGDSWWSGYSQSGTGNSQVLGKRNANKQRIRLDSVFGTQLPGFPYINSAAAADPLILASSSNLASGSGHYSTQDLRGRASRTWSDRSASAAGSYSIGSRFTGSRARSASGGMLSETSATTTSSARMPGGVAAFETDPANTSSNCSGGSNSSDDVDLDLSFDMEVLRERQHELQRQALRQRSNSQSVKGKQPDHGSGQPPFDISGHTVPEDDEEEAEGDMLPGRGLYGTEDYRRYRLQGKQRMSRSAVELRSLHASTECHYDPPQPSFARDQLPSRRYSGQSDPGLIRKGQPTSWARQPLLAELSDRSAEVDLRDEPDSFGIDDELSAPNPSHANPLGWSSATTPPLSPAELVTFAEQQPGYSDGRRRGSFGATLASGSNLLRKRRPSFPLLNLLDRAKPKGHGGVDDGTRAESAVDMRPEEPGHASPAFGSPTPTREMYTSRHNSYTDNLAPLPPPPIIPAAVDAYPLSPIGSSLASPSGFSSPGTMTADLTPGTSAWNSPKMQDMDEAPTPRSGDFDEHDVGLAGDDLRFSQYSMTSAGVRTSALGVRKSLQALPSKAQKDEGSPEQNPDEKEPYKRSHVRQSSSIFRLPFSSLLFNPFRPASPAQTVKVPPIIEDDGNSGEATPTASKAPTIRPVENADATDATARPTSPASSDSHAPSSAQHGSGEGGSDESHGLSSDPPSPPRAGAKPSRLSAVIDGSMLRPGPTTGRGQMGGYGLGLSLDQEGGHPEGAPEALAQRQSSLPVLAFSSASSDENHGSSTSASSHSSQQAGGRVHQVVRTRMTSPSRLPQHHRIQIVEPSPQDVIRRVSMSAPATTVHFYETGNDQELRSRMDASSGDASPQTASPRMQSHPTVPSVPRILHRRPRTLLPKTSDLDLRGRIDSLRPSQALFLAAFVLGPWCFVIGGWGLRNIDGEFASVKGVPCRCEAEAESCACPAEVYRQVRLSGGKVDVSIQKGTMAIRRTPQQASEPQPDAQQQQSIDTPVLQIRSMDRYVVANRIAALLCGIVSLVLCITALIVLGRAW